MQYQAKLQSCACLLVPKTNIIRTALPAALVLDFSCLFPNLDQYTTLLQLITNSAEQTPESAWKFHNVQTAVKKKEEF